jgi:hypothetical protein
MSAPLHALTSVCVGKMSYSYNFQMSSTRPGCLHSKRAKVKAAHR